MGLTITRKALMALGPCSPERRMPGLGEDAEWGVREALAAGVSVDDILWVVARMGRADLCVRFALLCAQDVAYLNPDPRVQAALDAAGAYLADSTSEAAAGAARAAAWAARAAAAAEAAAAGAAWAAAAAEAAAEAAAAAGAAAGAAWAARAAAAAEAAAAGAAWAAAAREAHLVALLAW